ncbi:hypothetical protein C8T65DRAFT_708394 [Cerioporus squamosus]|nr:hypothetical protein C8T65DRAFT_708394 [Cerioporus squamosus]
MADPLFPLTIDDTSPVVRYSPFADTFSAPNTAQGWNPFYTDSGFATVNSGAGSAIGPAIGNGTSLHLTACDGAALQIDWNGECFFTCEAEVRAAEAIGDLQQRALVWRQVLTCVGARRVPFTPGTDITLFGTLVLPLDQSQDIPMPRTLSCSMAPATTNFIASLSMPAVVQNAATDVLVSFRNLQDGPHTLQVVLHNPGDTDDVGNSTSGPIMAFDRAVVQVGAGMPNTTSSSSASTPTATASTAPVPDSEVAFRGQWDFEPTLLPGSSASFHTSTNVGDKATLQFNGSAVGLTGLTTPACGAFNVSLDQERPVTVSARASFTSSSPTLLFFRSGLDPSVMHSIEVVNAGPAGAGDDAGSLLVLGAVNVTTMQPPGATPVGAAGSSSLPRGAIAGLAIGVTLAVAALVAAIIFLVRRRRRNSRRKRQMLVNPQINRAGRLSFLFPHKRRSEAISERDAQKALEGGGYEAGGVTGVLDIRSPTPVHEKEDSDDSEVEDEGEGEDGKRLSAAEKGKERALRRSNASKNSDGSYSIELPDLTIAQVPRGYLPASAVPSTPSPPRTLIPSPTSPRTDGRPIVPPEAHISPLRVEFASDVQGRPEGRGERHISTGAISLPQSLRQALSQQVTSQVPVPPSPTRSDRIYSFLDFSSTSTSLSRSQRQSSSNSTGKSRSSSTRENGNSNSGQSSQAVNWASLPPDRRISLGLSMTLGAVPNINVTLHPVPLFQSSPALSSPDQQTPSTPESPEQEGPDQPFPYDANQLPSPTDSVPYTVSDIHFRHSTHSSILSMPTAESRRAGSHRPPHPPLPSAGPSSPTRPTHQRGGSQAGSQSVPPFIVQRILGRTPGTGTASSPTVPQFASMTAATAARTSATPSPTPSRAAHASTGSGTGSGTGAGPAQTTTPGSSTSVFGFQLGRHR